MANLRSKHGSRTDAGKCIKATGYPAWQCSEGLFHLCTCTLAGPFPFPAFKEQARRKGHGWGRGEQDSWSRSSWKDSEGQACKDWGHDSRVKGRSIEMMHGYGTPWMAQRKLFNRLYAGYKLAARINFYLTPLLLLGQHISITESAA